MDNCLSNGTYSSAILHPLPSPARPFPPSPRLSFSFDRFANCCGPICISLKSAGFRPGVVVACGGGRRSSGSQFREYYCGLNAPLQPMTAAGRLLSGVLLDDREYFPQFVEKQLEQLAVDRDETVARMNLSLRSVEACLHRRIAKLKEHECQAAVEEIMYLLVCFKFSEIRVHLVPQLSKCIYDGRLQIWPSKDWELESIHNFEVLEMIKEHLTACVGWRANSNVTDKWTKTQVPRLQLCRMYTASVLFGYFLKSACLRHSLENSLTQINFDLGINMSGHLSVSPMWSSGSKDVSFGHMMNTRSTSLGQVSCTPGKKQEDLKCFLMGFDSQTLQMCAKPRSKEAVRLIERHCTALFGDEETGLLETNEEILTSFATLKRVVLEAIALGTFLWEAESHVNTIYQLQEH